MGINNGKGQDWLVEWIKLRLFGINKNVIIYFVGGPGMSKSYSALSVGHDVNSEVNWGFSELEFVGRYVTPQGRIKENTRGDVHIWDDVGATGGSAYDWSTKAGKSVKNFSESFRMLNTALFLTVPTAAMANVNFRRLAHLILWCVYIDYKNERALLKVFKDDYNPIFDKARFVHPKIKTEYGSIKLGKIWISKPPDDLIEQYESDKRKALSKRWSSLLADLT